MQDRSYDPSTPMRTRGRGQQGTLQQLRSGRWQAGYRENGRKGRRVRKAFDTKAQAQRWLRERLAELDAIRNGDTTVLIREREAGRTAEQAVADWLKTCDVLPSTLKSRREELQPFLRTFRQRLLATIESYELAAWRLSLTEGWRHRSFKTARAMFKDAHRWHWIATNPSDGIKNPRGAQSPKNPLPWDHALLLADELPEAYEAVPIVGCGTGLRPEEWLALERGDVDLDDGVLHVRRIYSAGRLYELPEGGEQAKGHRQRRRVPLCDVVAAALDRTLWTADRWPRRIDTQLLWPKRYRRGDTLHLNLNSWRELSWAPAFVAAGLPYQRPYDMRHTYASESIAAGVGLFDLSRFMGTSLEQIDKTYGHLVNDSEDRNRDLLNAYHGRRAA